MESSFCEFGVSGSAKSLSRLPCLSRPPDREEHSGNGDECYRDTDSGTNHAGVRLPLVRVVT
jgi:hypothetical protein